jgi:hypothetical protein
MDAGTDTTDLSGLVSYDSLSSGVKQRWRFFPAWVGHSSLETGPGAIGLASQSEVTEIGLKTLVLFVPPAAR